MRKSKFLFTIIICTIIINLIIPVYADDEIEEEGITEKEIQEIIETSADVTDIPKINSRYAVIYDRTSR